MKLSIIVPVYNEYLTIRNLVRRIQSLSFETQLIIVDDGSTDGTTRLLREIEKQNSEEDITVIFSEKNNGKGWALREGILHVSGDIVIFQDADLEYTPDEYNALIDSIRQNKADAVFGSRFLSTRRILYFSHYLGNKLLNLISGIVLGINITDIGSGCKAFRTDVLKSITLRANGFGIETEIAARILQKNYRLYEVPIEYYGRTFDEGKKTTIRTFFSLLLWLFRSLLTGKDMGADTLYKLKYISYYNSWIFQRIKPYVGQKILEIGSGIGNISKFLVGKELLVLSEINPYYIAMLQRRFGGNDEIIIKEMDIRVPDVTFFNDHPVDTVIMLNVLEHIDDDAKVFKNISRLMRDDTQFILLVPAHRSLYGSLDRQLDHKRRYSAQDIETLCDRTGFEIQTMFYHNIFGVPGWFLNARILKRRYMSRIQMRLFDMCVPLLSRIERLVKIPCGLSLIAIIKKKKT